MPVIGCIILLLSMTLFYNSSIPYKERSINAVNALLAFSAKSGRRNTNSLQFDAQNSKFWEESRVEIACSLVLILYSYTLVYSLLDIIAADITLRCSPRVTRNMHFQGCYSVTVIHFPGM